MNPNAQFAAGPHVNGPQTKMPDQSYMADAHLATKSPRHLVLVGQPVVVVVPPAREGAGGSTNPVKIDTFIVRHAVTGELMTTGPVTITGNQNQRLTLGAFPIGSYRVYFYYKGVLRNPEGDSTGEMFFHVVNKVPEFLSQNAAGWDFDLRNGVAAPTATLNARGSAGPHPILIKITGTLIGPSRDGLKSVEVQFNRDFHPPTAGCDLNVGGVAVIDRWQNAYKPTNKVITLDAGKEYPLSLLLAVPPGMPEPPIQWNYGHGWNDIPPANLKNLSVTRYTGFHSTAPGNDQVMRSFCGCAMGMQRIGVVQGKKFSDFAGEFRAWSMLEKNADPKRKMGIIVSFGHHGTANQPTSNAEVEQFLRGIIAAGYNPADIWIEGTNEPDLTMPFGSTPENWVNNVQKPFYALVKRVDQRFRVMGPSTVENDKTQLVWISDAIKHGLKTCIDGFAFHAYNSANGDLALLRASHDQMRSFLNQNGMDNLIVFQTEQGEKTGMYGVYSPRHAIHWTVMRLLVGEQYGLKIEHTHNWYDRSHGFWNHPTFVNFGAGNCSPLLLAFMTIGEHLKGRTHAGPIVFPGAQNDYYAGSWFVGDDQTKVLWLISNGNPEGVLSFNVTGASAVSVSDWQGRVSTYVVTNGRVAIPVDDLGVFVRCPAGVTLGAVDELWGTDLNRQAKVTASNGEADGGLTNNGIREFNSDIRGHRDWYWDTSLVVWRSSAPDPKGAWLQYTYPAPVTINKVIVECPPMWQNLGSLLDHEVQAWVDGQWKTIRRKTIDPLVIEAYSYGAGTTAENYHNEQHVFEHNFAAVTTDKIRIVCHLPTYGGEPTLIARKAGGQGSEGMVQTFTVRSVEAYFAGLPPVVTPGPVPPPPPPPPPPVDPKPPEPKPPVVDPRIEKAKTLLKLADEKQRDAMAQTAIARTADGLAGKLYEEALALMVEAKKEMP